MAETMKTEQRTAQESVEAAKRGVERLKEGEPTQAAMEVQEVMPSRAYAYAAGASILASAILFSSKKTRDWSLFIGEWAPTFLLMGLFYKMLKPSQEK